MEKHPKPLQTRIFALIMCHTGSLQDNILSLCAVNGVFLFSQDFFLKDALILCNFASRDMALNQKFDRILLLNKNNHFCDCYKCNNFMIVLNLETLIKFNAYNLADILMILFLEFSYMSI